MKIFKNSFVKRRNDIPVDELDPLKCNNCQFEFKGHYCPNCGQEVAEFNRPFGFILYDFAGNFFAFDTRFFRTFKYLLLRPGYLAVEFFKGKRASYSPPFRTFVFLSFVLFILLQSLTEKSLDRNASIDIKNSLNDSILNKVSAKEIKQTVQSELILSGVVTPNSLSKDDTRGKNFLVLEDDSLNIDFSIFKSGSIRDNLNKLADSIEVKANKTTDASKRKKYNTYVVMCRAPEIVISNFIKYLSWMFFILLPVFALLLKLFYLRRKQLFIKHIIFSIYLHSYLFIIMILVISMKLLTLNFLSYISLALIITLPVYFIIALKKFYGQNYGKVILKFIGISIIYLIIITSTVTYVFGKSLGLV